MYVTPRFAARLGNHDFPIPPNSTGCSDLYRGFGSVHNKLKFRRAVFILKPQHSPTPAHFFLLKTHVTICRTQVLKYEGGNKTCLHSWNLYPVSFVSEISSHTEKIQVQKRCSCERNTIDDGFFLSLGLLLFYVISQKKI